MPDTNFFTNFAEDNSFDDRLVQTGKNKYLQNEDALKYLKEQQSNWNNILLGVAGASALGLAGFSLIALFGALGTALSIELSIPIDQVIKVMEILLNEFQAEGITITPRIETKLGLIDLIVRTTDGRFFAFMIRSNGQSRVRWRDDRQEFFAVRKKGMPKWSGLKLLGDRLNDMVLFLKEEENPLLGESKSQRKKGIIKAIILVGKTTIDPNNEQRHLVSFGRTTALKVCGTATYFLVDLANLANFIRKPES